MDPDNLGLYLKALIPLIQASEYDFANSEKILNLIEEHQNRYQGDPVYVDFFKGERYFYQGQFENALKQYIKTKSLSLYHFFCYRASGYLYSRRGNGVKALSFIKKALKIVPDDYLSLQLFSKLIVHEGMSEEGIDTHRPMSKLKLDVSDSLSLGKKEHTLDQEVLKELAHIFEEHPAAEELFSEEKDINPNPSVVLKEHPFNFQANPMEIFMNTEADIFSSPKSTDTGSTQKLTKRLYSHAADLLEQNPYANGQAEVNFSALEELKKLAESSLDIESPSKNFMAEGLGSDLKAGFSLAKKITSFEATQKEHVGRYLKENSANRNRQDFALFYLNGWPSGLSDKNAFPLPILLTEQTRKSRGGIFIRWNGKGIAINPGENFLQHFHAQGLHIYDIDYVIVTGSKPSSYAEVQELYDINYELNKVSPSLHVIHYYFCHQAYQELSRVLKPHFKQERETLHSLEIFLDSPDIEKVELAEGILLQYFSTSSRDTISSRNTHKDDRNDKNNAELGIKLDLKTLSADKEEKSSLRIGYIGQCPWNPLQAHHLGHCDLLMTHFGNASTNDINKISYQSDCLGYHGTYTLLEEVAPKLLLCGEFSGREGDIRLEVCQKIRQDYQAQMRTSQRDITTILPADAGFCMNLKELKIKCSISDDWIAPGEVQVTKTSDSFGKLIYLAPSCCY